VVKLVRARTATAHLRLSFALAVEPPGCGCEELVGGIFVRTIAFTGLTAPVSPSGPHQEDAETSKNSKTHRPKRRVDCFCIGGSTEEEQEKKTEKDNPRIIFPEHSSPNKT
jgi:hypothetical protein